MTGAAVTLGEVIRYLAETFEPPPEYEELIKNFIETQVKESDIGNSEIKGTKL